MRAAPVALIACLASAQTVAEPLPTTNQNPFIASLGLPAPLPARLDADVTQLAATLNWASTAIVDTDADEILIADAETRELRLAVTHAFNDHLALRVELPYLYTSGGTLDGFIDDFHDTFGFSEGDRPLFRRNQLTLWYLRSGQASFVNRTRSTEGVGDLSLSLGTSLMQSEHSAAAAWFGITAPTAADGAYITGGDDWKLSATLSGTHRLAGRWTLFAQASATVHTGKGVFDQQQDVIWNGIASLEWAATRRIFFNVQVQAHSAPIEGSDLTYFGDAIVLTVGGSIRASDTLTVNVGLSEDVQVEASPDAAFVVGLSMRR